MISLRLTTKRELDLWKATILDMREQLKAMRSERDHERARSEGAINALLARTAKITLPAKDLIAIEDEIDRQNDLFQDEEQEKLQAKFMEEMQS